MITILLSKCLSEPCAYLKAFSSNLRFEQVFINISFLSNIMVHVYLFHKVQNYSHHIDLTIKHLLKYSPKIYLSSLTNTNWFHGTIPVVLLLLFFKTVKFILLLKRTVNTSLNNNHIIFY